MEVLDELVFEAGFRAFQVGVFNAEEKKASIAAGEKPVVQSSARVAYVEKASRGWGKTDAGGRRIHSNTE